MKIHRNARLGLAGRHELIKAIEATGQRAAARQLSLFRNELDKGKWVYPARYRSALPKKGVRNLFRVRDGPQARKFSGINRFAHQNRAI